jgi:hypothetical protein
MSDDKDINFDIVDRLIDKVADLGGESSYQSYRCDYLEQKVKNLKEALDKANQAVIYYQSKFEDQKKETEVNKQSFTNLHSQISLYLKEREKPITKDILNTFLILYLKDNVFPTDNAQARKTIISLIRIYRHMTGETLPVCKSEVYKIINNIDSIEVVEVSTSEIVNIKDIKNIPELTKEDIKTLSKAKLPILPSSSKLTPPSFVDIKEKTPPSEENSNLEKTSSHLDEL